MGTPLDYNTIQLDWSNRRGSRVGSVSVVSGSVVSVLAVVPVVSLANISI